MGDIWFTADTHFDHANIIKLCNRPFEDIAAMNAALIHNWNKVVKPNDTIFHLGDFCLSNKPFRFFSKLNGNKLLILGNHDKKSRLVGMFGWVKDTYELKSGKVSIWLSHYAHRSWPKSCHGSVHLFGHSHGVIEDYGRSTDVGVDSWNFRPVNIDEIYERMHIE